jgi:arylsulfatase
VAYWPRGIARPGRISSELGHLIDIMATCLEVAGADYPTEVNGMKIPPLEGRSFLPIFQGRTREGHEALFWNQRGLWRAVRQGRWKLVSPDHWIRYQPWRAAGRGGTIPPVPGDSESLWQLFDLDADRTERRDLASRYPDRVKAMGRLYQAWKQRVSEDWESALEVEIRAEE